MPPLRKLLRQKRRKKNKFCDRTEDFGIGCKEILCRRLFYVSDAWLYPVLDSSGDSDLALLPQSGISNPAGADPVSVRVQSFL